jgi:alpha-beta hydrolase superfamily lysophospholipase
LRTALLVAVVAAALGWAGQADAGNFTKAEASIPMDDGVALAASYYEPLTQPPAGGYPAIIMFHGLGGTRASTNTIAESSFANEGFAVLTFDFRGHGRSGGLFSADGPREIADVRALYAWLVGHSEINRTKVGAWGISLGGGAIWRSLVEGVPFAAAEVVETWTDLLPALAPQGLAKSGLLFGFLSSVPADRTSPDVTAVRDDSLASRLTKGVTDFSTLRSSIQAADRITTPVLMFQGRRDYAFDIAQAADAFHRLKGPKRLYIGDFGHPPSTFPGPDIAVVLAEGSDWFGRFLKDQPNGIDKRPPVELAPDPFKEAGSVSFGDLPATKTLAFALKGSATIGASGKVVRAVKLPRTLVEQFGAPTVKATLSARGTAFPHLVAVLSATLPDGRQIVVDAGGTALTLIGAKPRTVTFKLLSWATTLPAGSRVTLTLAGTSTAQDPANLVYLAAVPDDTHLTIGKVALALPVLKKPVSG